MADAVQVATLQIPGGGGPGNLWFVDAPLGWSEVEQITVQFPPGCSGLVGARIEFAVSPVYPVEDDQWFIADDYTFSIPVSNQGTSGQWRFTGYNSDSFTHTLYAWFFYNYPATAPQSSSSSMLSL